MDLFISDHKRPLDPKERFSDWILEGMAVSEGANLVIRMSDRVSGECVETRFFFFLRLGYMLIGFLWF